MLNPRVDILTDQDRISAFEYNQRGQVLKSVTLSRSGNSFLDSSGLHTRFLPIDEPMRKAYCKDDASAAQIIDCYLDTDNSDTIIAVNCSVLGGGNLNVAVPRLFDGDLIFVNLIGTEWYCINLFQPSIECVCTPP